VRRDAPRFTLHDTGIRTSTRECVRKAETRGSPEIDRRMDGASREACAGLILYSKGIAAEGLAQVASAMTEAQACFEAWGLVPQGARIMGESLKRQGALGVKLTGAGGGGFLVALWPD